MADRLPKNKLPKDFGTGLFTPEFIVRNVNLNDFVVEAELPRKSDEAVKRVERKVRGQSASTRGDVPIPLTEAEAVAADERIASTLARIQYARERIVDAKAQIDEAITFSTGGKELSFKMDISKKKSLQRAIKKLFGQKLDTITYNMYKEMLVAKHQLEKEEIQDFAKGKTKDDEE